MKVVEVIPLSRGVFKDSLTYFTALAVQPGALVLAPVRGRTVPALVTEVREPAEIKLALKDAAFSLQKIETRKTESFFLPAFMRAVERYTDYCLGTRGQIIKALVPQAILLAPTIKSPRLSESTPRNEVKPEKLALQDTDEERFVFYRRLIREAFARNESVFLCLPTAGDVKTVLGVLGRGIKNYVGIFHNQLTNREVVSEWNRMIASRHAMLAIGTPLFLSLPRLDWRLVIVDRENSPAYKGPARPFVDARKFAELLAEELGARFILGDLVLRTETAYLLQRRGLQPALPIRHHSFSTAESTLIDLTKEPSDKKTHPLLSAELLNALESARLTNERFFIFANRRGLAPLIICQDCSTPVACPECGAIVTLHGAAETELTARNNVLVCHRCGWGESAAVNCRVCQSWRLKELGVGIEQVEKTLLIHRPDLKIHRFDSDQIKTPRQAEALVQKFMTGSGQVLLGTEMALYYLKDKIENVAVAAIDSMFTLPEFRINEKVFNLLTRLRALALKRFFLQTRHAEQPLFEFALRGNLLDFYRAELRDREEFEYPPFRLLVKISRLGEKMEVLTEMNRLTQELKEYQPNLYQGLSDRAAKRYRLNLLIKLRSESWPDRFLIQKLRSLSPDFLIEIDPLNVL